MNKESRKAHIILWILCICLFSGCGKNTRVEPQTDIPSKTALEDMWDETEQDKTELYVPPETMEPEKIEAEQGINAILLDGNGVYRKVKIQKGGKIDIPELKGYDFLGYENENKDKVQYIDENGNVVKPYNGTEILQLCAVFKPQEFKICFLFEGKELNQVKPILCQYDQSLSLDELHVGTELLQNGIRCCITGVKSLPESGVGLKGKKSFQIKDLGDSIDYESRKVTLELAAIPLNLPWNRFDTYTIQDKGFQKQKLNNAGDRYDCFEFPYDIEKLQEMGYNTIRLKIKCGISDERSGKQAIYILNHWPEKDEKEKEFILFSDTKIDMEKNAMRYESQVIELPIDKFTENVLYVAYDAGGSIKRDYWYSDFLEIEKEIIKK